MALETKIKIVIDGQESIQTVGELTSKIDEFKQKLSGLDENSDEFKRLNEAVQDLEKALGTLTVNVDNDEALEALATVQKSFETIDEIAAEPVDVNINAEPAVQSISDIRTELKAVQDTIATSEFGSEEFVKATERAAELKDQLDDINEAVNNVKGEPIEQLGNQFASVKDSVSKLDFKKASEQLTTFNGTIKKLDVGKVASGFGQFAKTLGTTVVTSIRAVGTAILANPLLLLATVVVGIGAALFALKDKFKIIQVAIDAATLPIRTLIGALKDLSDFLGLSSFEADAAAAAQAEANDKIAASSDLLTKKIEEDTKRQIAAAKSGGASAEKLAEIEAAGAVKIIAAQEKILEGREAELKELQRKVEASEQLTEQEVANYERLAGAQNTILDQQQALADGTFALAKKAKEESDKAAADEAKKLAERKAEAEKYFNNLTKLQEKYLLTEEQRIQKQADAEIASLRGRGKVEEALRAEIQRKADEQIKKIQDDRLARATKASLDLQEAEARLELIRAQQSAKTDEERIAAQQKFNEQSLELTKKRIEEERKAIDNSTEKTTEEKLAAQAKLDADLLQAQADFNKKVEDQNREAAQKEFDAVRQRAQKEVEEVQKARQKLVAGFSDRIGVVGFKSAVNELNAALDTELTIIENARAKEQAALEAALEKKLLTEEEYQKQLKELNEKAAEDSTKATEENEAIITATRQERFQNTVDTLQQGLELFNQVSNAVFEQERAKLEEQQTELDSDYEKRKQIIEDTIADEDAKTAALTALDEEFADKQKALDLKDIELKKKQIKRERNAALAQIALSNAIAIANAAAAAAKAGAAAGPAAPIAFALTVASLLASIGITIAQARQALKEQDAAAAALGAGGGGGGGGTTTPAPPPTQPAPPSELQQATGINAAGFAAQPAVRDLRPVVSVVEIDRVRNSVEAIESGNTIGIGG